MSDLVPRGPHGHSCPNCMLCLSYPDEKTSSDGLLLEMMPHTLRHRLSKSFDEKPKQLGDPVWNAAGARGIIDLKQRKYYV
jgi:hypothetical protein